MVKLNCWCGAEKHYEIGVKDDRLVVECAVCQTWYVKEIPNDYIGMYSRGEYATIEQTRIGYTPYPDRYEHDLGVAQARLSELHDYRTFGAGRKLIDVGCGNGAFVHTARAGNWEAYGIDLDFHVNEIHWCYQRDIEHLPPLDIMYGAKVITMYDVIEHLLKPVDTLTKLRDCLIPQGLLVIVAPDFSSGDAYNQGLDWKHVRPVQHIYMIKPQIMIGILKGLGFYNIDRRRPIPNQYAIYARRG